MDNQLTIAVRVIPRASKGEIVGMHDGALKVRIAAAPVDGAANAALIKLLSRFLGVQKTDIAIVSGASSRTKIVRITGPHVCGANRALANLLLPPKA